MIVLVIEILLKFIGFGMKTSERRNKMQQILLDFKAQYSSGVKKNVKIKRRYDEELQKLRDEK